MTSTTALKEIVTPIFPLLIDQELFILSLIVFAAFLHQIQTQTMVSISDPKGNAFKYLKAPLAASQQSACLQLRSKYKLMEFNIFVIREELLKFQLLVEQSNAQVILLPFAQELNVKIIVLAMEYALMVLVYHSMKPRLKISAL